MMFLTKGAIAKCELCSIREFIKKIVELAFGIEHFRDFLNILTVLEEVYDVCAVLNS